MATVERTPGRRIHVAGYQIARLDDGQYRWEVQACGIGVLQHSLFRAFVDHTSVAGLPLYRLPGYGVVYRTMQRWLHAHGRCVLKRSRIGDPDGNTFWACSWCGHSIKEQRGGQVSAFRTLSRLDP